MWRSRSAFQLYDRTRLATRNLTLTRFDRSKAALPYNLVLLTDTEARWLDNETRATGALPRMLLGGEHEDSTRVAPSHRVLLETYAVLRKMEAVWEADTCADTGADEGATSAFSCIIS